MYNKIHIRNGFIQSNSGRWVNLRYVDSIFVKEGSGEIYLYYHDQEKPFLLDEYPTHHEARKALNSAFNIYKGHDLPLIETLSEYDFYLPIRAENILKKNNINTLGEFYALIENGVTPLGIGKKTWRQMIDVYKKIKIIFI